MEECQASMKMKKMNKAAASSLWIFLLMMIMLLPMSAMASEGYGKNYSYPLPVTVNVTGENVPADATFVVKLEAITEGAPMPSKDTLSFTGAGTASFDAIAYSVPEDYHYRVYQVAGSQADMVYDTTEYEIIVHVTNGSDGQLTGTIVSRMGSGEKPESVSFTNKYTKVPEPATDEPETETESESEKPTPKSAKTHKSNNKTNQTEKTASSTGSVKTGDETPIGLWIAVLALAGAAVIVLVVLRRRGSTKE